MKLTDLEPCFVHDADAAGSFRDEGADFGAAQGVLFECPVCSTKPRGSHSILVWFRDRGVPDHLEPLPRWQASGSGLGDLTLTPSVDCTVNSHPECWHGNITNGEIVGGI